MLEGLFWVFIGGPVLIILVCSPLFILLAIIVTISGTPGFAADKLEEHRRKRRKKAQLDPDPEPSTKVAPEKDQVTGAPLSAGVVDCVGGVEVNGYTIGPGANLRGADVAGSEAAK